MDFKLCPFTFNDLGRGCTTVRCAWWNDSDSECCILTVAKGLKHSCSKSKQVKDKHLEDAMNLARMS